MFADSRFDYLSRLRYYAAMAVTPLHYLASLPGRAFDDMRGTVRSRDELAAENEELRDQLMMQQYQLQKLNYLTAENDRLNELLKASAIVEEEVVRVQLIGESPDPVVKRILINKGSTEGVYVGQPVIDASGLMGQVVEVTPVTSWVLLITDPQHGTPVQVIRNGIRAIAYGTRDALHQLTLTDVPNTADIKEGDELFTSGLDNKFPPGYPVGVITSIYHDPGKPFADVVATPTAQIDRSRNLLLVFRKAVEAPVPAAVPADEAVTGEEVPADAVPAEATPPAEAPQAAAPQTDATQTGAPATAPLTDTAVPAETPQPDPLLQAEAPAPVTAAGAATEAPAGTEAD
jgi:rod shape-determining protein MreC